MKILSYKKQSGFSLLAIILVIVVVVVTIGVWAISGSINTDQNSANSDYIKAESIINDAATYKDSFDQLVGNGINASNIVFIPNTPSTATNPNMLDPNNGKQYSTVSANVLGKNITSPEGIWIYNPTGLKGKDIGSSSSDQAIILAGISDSVCKKINIILYGNIPTPKLDPMSPNAWISDATISNPTSNIAIDLNPNIYSYNAPIGWTMGCLNMRTVDHSIFFYILKVN